MLVVVSVIEVAQLAGECELQVMLLDVKLSSLALPGNSVTTIGTETGEDTPS